MPVVFNLILLCMEFKKIQLTKQNTLTVVFKNESSDTVTIVGANIVHKDLKKSLRALIPHMVLLTEAKESVGKTLAELQKQDGLDDEKSVYRRYTVMDVVFNEKEVEVALSGTRILDRGDVVSIDTPKLNVEEDEHYEYLSDLALAVDDLKYEAKLYVEEKKWGLKEGTLNFGEAGDPFKEVKPGDVPEAKVSEKKRKGKKKNRDEAA